MKSLTIVSAGASSTSTGAAVLMAIPLDSSGGRPRFVRVSATASVYIKAGDANVVAAAGDAMIQPGDSTLIDAGGCYCISIKSLAGTATVNIQASEYGRWDYPGTFSVSDLFLAGERGAWYDPSDFSTLFQDSAGTTPVTGVAQPVGLMLDKRLAVGPEIVVNGKFDTNTAGWTSGAVFASTAAAVAGELQVTPTADYGRQLYVFPTIIGKSYQFSGSARVVSGSGTAYLGYSQDSSNGSGAPSFAQSSSGAAVSGTVVLKATTTTMAVIAGHNAAGGFSGVVYAFDNISVRELPGNHASQPTAINRPVLQQDGSGKFYLAFNGTSSWMSTAAIDFTATDKMTVVAGVRKLSDAAVSMVAELSIDSNSNNGSLFIVVHDAGGREWSSLARGTAPSVGGQAAYSTVPAPDTAVLSITHDIVGDLSALRRSGVAGFSGAAEKGAGNFGNYPLYIGARAGSSLFFQGNIYSLIVRGALSSNAQITSAETYVAGKTGVTL